MGMDPNANVCIFRKAIQANGKKMMLILSICFVLHFMMPYLNGEKIYLTYPHILWKTQMWVQKWKQ